MKKFIKIFSLVVEVLTSLLPIVSKFSKTDAKNDVSTPNVPSDEK